MDPYIGITGFMESHEIETCLRVMPQDSKYRLMVGLLISNKTLRGITNKWPNRYPVIDRFKDLIIDHPLALNMVHFNTKDYDMLLNDLDRIIELSQGRINGFQLNMVWPDPGALAFFKKAHPDKLIILQVGIKAMQVFENDPKDIANIIVSNYAPFIDYILIDPSCGLGLPLDTEKGLAYLKALLEKKVKVGLGIAGGLSADTLNLIEPIVSEIPNICIDAEGRLRDENDQLDLELACNYLRRANWLLNK